MFKFVNTKYKMSPIYNKKTTFNFRGNIVNTTAAYKMAGGDFEMIEIEPHSLWTKFKGGWYFQIIYWSIFVFLFQT